MNPHPPLPRFLSQHALGTECSLGGPYCPVSFSPAGGLLTHALAHSRLLTLWGPQHSLSLSPGTCPQTTGMGVTFGVIAAVGRPALLLGAPPKPFESGSNP